MPTLTTGRPLDEDGDPLDGPALELDTESRAADLLAESPHALASGPGTGMWSVLLDDPETASRPEMVAWLAPDAVEFPAHVHETSPESFEVLSGRLTVFVEGERRVLAPGEEHAVEPGEEHYVRNQTDGFVAFRVTPPWAKTVETQYTFFGLDHEGEFGPDGEFGEPGILYGLVMSETISEETRVTAAPQVFQRATWATLGNVASLLGHEAIERRFLEDEFWREHVEQPVP